MIRLQSRRLLILVSIYAIAVLAGGVAALAAPSGVTAPLALNNTTAVASAANHCTNYFPVSYQPDNGCANMHWMYAYTWGETSATALRDDNCMITLEDRSLYVWYGEYTPATTYGTNICLLASIGYQKAGCQMASPVGVNGRCETSWHD